VPAVIAALVVIALGVGLAWPFLQLAVTGSAPAWANSAAAWLAQRRWADGWTVTVIVLAAVLGLIMIIAAAVPGKTRSYQLEAVDQGTDPGPARASDIVITRRGLARLATAQAHRVSGVETASAAVDGSRVRLELTTYVPNEAAVADQVRDLVGQSFAAAGLSPAPRVSVSASRAPGVA
jgi:hypothetical protein